MIAEQEQNPEKKIINHAALSLVTEYHVGCKWPEQSIHFIFKPVAHVTFLLENLCFVQTDLFCESDILQICPISHCFIATQASPLYSHAVVSQGSSKIAYTLLYLMWPEKFPKAMVQDFMCYFILNIPSLLNYCLMGNFGTFPCQFGQDLPPCAQLCLLHVFYSLCK